MGLKYEVSNANELDETVKGFYVESGDGKFRLDVEGVESREAVQGLKSALEQERCARKAMEKELSGFKGFSPEDLHKMKDELDELRLEKENKPTIDKLSDAEKKKLLGEQVDKYVEIRTRALERQLKEAQEAATKSQTELAALTTKRQNETRDLRVLKAANGRILPSANEDLRLRAEHRLQYDPDANDYRDETGMGLEDWVEAQIAANPHWLPGSRGGGADGGAGAETAPKNGRDYIMDIWGGK